MILNSLVMSPGHFLYMRSDRVNSGIKFQKRVSKINFVNKHNVNVKFFTMKNKLTVLSEDMMYG